MRIVKIKSCVIEENHCVKDGEEIEVRVDSENEAWENATDFISKFTPEEESTICHFWGTWKDKRVLFLCNDNGFALRLDPNKQATLAYLGQCLPGTMHVVVGPVVALLHRDLWG